MNIQNNRHQWSVDSERRWVLKSFAGITSVAATSPLFAVGNALAGAGMSAGQAANPSIDGADFFVEFSFVDSKTVDGFVALGQGTLVNRSHHDLLISNLHPSVIRTSNGSYDISAYLAENPVQLKSGSQRYFWVRPVSALTPSAALGSALKEHGRYPFQPEMQASLDVSIESPRLAVGSNRRSVPLSIEPVFA